MRIKLIIATIILAMGSLLFWQVSVNGELSEKVKQRDATILQQEAQAIKERERNARTSAELAKSFKQLQINQRNQQALSDELKQLEDGCVNAPIPDSVIERVQRFRSGNNGNDSRASTVSVD